MKFLEFEFVILDRLGILSVWYTSIRSHLPFLAVFTLTLIAARLLGRRTLAQDPVLHRTALVAYSAVAASATAVALWDVAVSLFIQQSFPKEDVAKRLSFVVRPELVAIENILGFLTLVLVSLALLLRGRHRNVLINIFARPGTRAPKTLLLGFGCAGVTVLAGTLMSAYPYVLGIEATHDTTLGLSLRTLTARLASRSPMAALIVALILTSLVATGEELLFRGVIYSGLRHKCGISGALALESAMFSIYHSKWLWTPYMLYFFIAGASLTWLYEQTRSIYPPITVHAALLAVSIFAGLAFRG